MNIMNPLQKIIIPIGNKKKLIKINIIILELNQKKQIMKRAKIKITIRILIKKY